MEKQTKIIILILLVLGIYFYWNDIRPSQIKSECAKEIRYLTNRPESFNSKYNQCLKINGL
jgi:hypothetical protein